MKVKAATSQSMQREPIGSLPNLIVAGAMKCGTTSLHDYLEVHPHVSMSRPKEVDFFAGGNSSKSLEWYKSLFDSQSRVRGESSQNYTKRHHPTYANAIQNMHGTIPDAKIIYIVRDPIERYKSHLSYNYYTVSRKLNKWAEESEHFFKTGLYHYQLENILNFYPLEQILILDSDNLRNQRLATMNSVFDFLGIPKLANEAAFDFASNEYGSMRVPVSVRSMALVRIASKVAPALTEKALRSPLAQSHFLRNGGEKSISAEEAERLRDAYAPDVDKLRALTGLNFQSWSI